MLPHDRTMAMLITIVLLLGLGTVTLDSRAETGNPAVADARAVETQAAPELIPAAPEGLDAVRRYRSVREQERAAAPAAIAIPALGIEDQLTRTGLNEDRTLEVPDFGDISWFAGGTVPGDPGPAAILGHVDSRTGPDVFFRLHELAAGDEVTVTDEDGVARTFVVDRVEQHAKDEFPTESVWLPTPDAELRLITCGGDFDTRERSYRDNIIVFASLQS
jgi:sortase (surface protein transpeptidase)